MNRLLSAGRLLAPAVLFCLTATACGADEPSPSVIEQVNQKMVKIFGSGGFRGIPAFGSGVIVSPDGYVLTVNSQMLDTRDLRVHLPDGTKYSQCQVVATEPELDIALVKINFGTDKHDDLPYFDVFAAAKKPTAEVGDSVFAFSNCFEIAQRDDLMTVQHGVVAAFAKLQGRNGIFEAPYTGKVYVVDAITNNPGAAGGALTNRKGELLGLVGRGLRNELTNTWMNYSVPINAAVEIRQPDGKMQATSILDLVEKKEKYAQIVNPNKTDGSGEPTFTGIILVANPVEITPPYVEDVMPGSPAALAGLKPDDLIVYVDGVSVKTINGYKDLMRRYRPNDKPKLEVRRGEKLTTVEITLAPKKTGPK